MSEIAILLEDVHFHYQVYADTHSSVANGLKRRFSRKKSVAVHALQGINLTVYDGEVLGLIGHNGAGKSTLMKAISGAIVPTSGKVRVSSQPQQISVGWALNNSLSGRRNIALGLLGLGFHPDQVREMEQGVVDFAEIGAFIDLPLKSYSTGMRSRLSFAIATAASPKILLMDEALSAGDRDFRSRSIKRVNELKESAGTVIMASHALASVEQVCNRVLWLQDGKARMIGEPSEIIAAYQENGASERDTIEAIKGGRVQPKLNHAAGGLGG